MVTLEHWADGTTAISVDGVRVFTGDWEDAADIYRNILWLEGIDSEVDVSTAID